MRVIAGTARRTPLVAPPGADTRPTADRAKEGLFNILGTRVRGARFLDLFCGSGAVGIEALSRGAREAVFVERGKPALEALRKNLVAARVSGEVLPLPVYDAIEYLHVNGRCFDIIFLDPPYGGNGIAEALWHFAHAPVLGEGGCIVAETDAKLPLPEGVPFAPARHRDYGRTRFLFYQTEGTSL
ncbi:MAG: 16S rRNA (guanine(966)-N(2))-methyltransferase RsmD [Defluviitaleaceae bacterium]|nr:16S rRNA (guanine(966)-N(2))-methyltransferase RsmD [Defluviitaleaceae bacterium]MCL2238708.1 16S rRNA (guanine(966)-N(2))-methyltransferase RsmD [Defluviitaleaceae bacterium]